MYTLPNLGNTCYLNTTIQCLLSCDSFKNFLQNTEFKQNSILYFFKKIEPKNLAKFKLFVSHLHKKFKSNFDIFEQNDMCELLTILIDKMNIEISRNIHIDDNYNFLSNDSAINRLNNKCTYSFITHFKTEYSFLIPLFYSTLISQIHCGCQKIHHNYEYNNILQLNIIKKKDCTIIDCIDDFMEPYLLNNTNDNDNDKWTCDHCNQSILSKKSFIFWKLPKILLISFKRFVFNSKINKFIKINDPIEIPTQLDMSKWTVNNDNSIYNLKALGCHIGSIDYGHYFTILYDYEKNKWVEVDDEIVRDNKMFRSVYLCTYELNHL